MFDEGSRSLYLGTISFLNAIIRADPDLAKLNASRKAGSGRGSIFVISQTLYAFFFFLSSQATMSAVRRVQTDAYHRAASPIPGTTQLLAKPSSHITEGRLTQGWGGQLAGRVQLWWVTDRRTPDHRDASLWRLKASVLSKTNLININQSLHHIKKPSVFESFIILLFYWSRII